jgi:hypothetical protein
MDGVSGPALLSNSLQNKAAGGPENPVAVAAIRPGA